MRIYRFEANAHLYSGVLIAVAAPLVVAAGLVGGLAAGGAGAGASGLGAVGFSALSGGGYGVAFSGALGAYNQLSSGRPSLTGYFTEVGVGGVFGAASGGALSGAYRIGAATGINSAVVGTAQAGFNKAGGEHLFIKNCARHRQRHAFN